MSSTDAESRPGWQITAEEPPGFIPPDGRSAYTAWMTAERSELHELVDALPDDQVARALTDVRRLLPNADSTPTWPPAFFGMGVDKEGRTHLSERVDEILAVGFGGPRG